MNSSIVSVVVIVLSQLLQLIGVTVSSEAVETTLQTIVAVVGGIVVWYQRVFRLREVQLGEKSDVNVFGKKV